jgi:hypothetical protein
MRNLDQAINAFAALDARAIARCATTSAELSQELNPKRCFDELITDAIKAPALIRLRHNLCVARFETMKVYSALVVGALARSVIPSRAEITP